MNRHPVDREVVLAPTQLLDGMATRISLLASTGGVTLLSRSMVSRPLVGNPPVIDVAVGYRGDAWSSAI